MLHGLIVPDKRFIRVQWVLKVSDEEVIFLTGGDPTEDENNMRMFHLRCKLMLVTEGAEGSRYYTQVCIFFSKNYLFSRKLLCHELLSPVIIFSFN